MNDHTIFKWYQDHQPSTLQDQGLSDVPVTHSSWLEFTFHNTAS